MLSLLKISHKKIITSPSLWISIIFIAFFLGFAPSAIGGSVDTSLPGYNNISINVSSAIIITGLLITVITTFGESFVKIKSSLIYKNIQLNNKPKYQFYVSTITPIIVYSTLVFIFSMAFVAIFDSLGLLGVEKNIIDWSRIQWGYLFISLVTTISLGISISILLATLSKNLNTYTSLVWAYLFLVFFFGGSSVPIFLIRGDQALDAFKYISFMIPNTYTNFLFVDSMVGSANLGNALSILDIFLPIVLTGVFIGIQQLFARYK